MGAGLFAIVDTETTGLFPGGHDRIAEIAIVTMDRDGRVVDRWETLVNPQRDLGKQSIHQIRARNILSAPTFNDIAEELDWRLSGTVVVAHNLSFDARFLASEFERSGQPLPDFYLPRGLCTMRLAHQYLPGAGRSLQDCCDSFSIDLQNAHCAGDDAQAAAVLLSRYMELDGGLDSWDMLLEQAASTVWHQSPPAAFRAAALRPSGPALENEHFLERIIVRLPEFTGPAEHEEYLALLDRALLDRYLSAHEEAPLVQTANDVGIGRGQVAGLHAAYFEQVVDAAWLDGVLADAELADLERVALILGIGPATAEAAKLPRGPIDGSRSEQRPVTRSALDPGDLVVLTGDMSRPRAEIEVHLRQAGYVPHNAVTKKVKMLACADEGLTL